MNRIVASVTNFEQHMEAMEARVDVYRPLACPHCQLGGLWRHGCYYRKAAHRPGGGGSLNPVPVSRYLCPGCEGTCSRLPLCIAPRRWYDWGMQQVVLLLILAGCSLHQCSRSTLFERRTLRRWRDWLVARSESFAFFLRSRFAELGRSSDRDSFWLQVINTMSLGQAMAWLDRDLIVP